MRPRFVGRLGLADAITVANAAIGLVAAAVATTDPWLAARLILLAAIADGLDGVVARRRGSTPAGPHLDSLSDAVSFGAAPALIVAAVAMDAWQLDLAQPTPLLAVALGAPALYLVSAVVRLGMYMAYDAGSQYTQGVQTTLAGTIVAAAVLSQVAGPAALVALAALLSYLMVSTVAYPDLLAQDALIMGAVQAVAVIAPDFLGRAFPYALLVLALAYLFLAPRFYWRPRPAPA